MKIIKTMYLILFCLTLPHSAKTAEKLTLSKVNKEQLGQELVKPYSTALRQPSKANLCRLLIPAKDKGSLKKIVCCAIVGGHTNILGFFLTQNEEVAKMRLSCGGTPLHIAAQSNQPAITQMLVDANGDANARADNDFTPLHYAAQYSDPEVMQVLLKAKADIEAEDSTGTTALRICTPQKLYDNAKFLIDAGANRHSALKSNNSTVLHSAAEHNNIALMRLLLAPEESDDYVHVAMNDGATAFHRACLSGKEAACDVLLEAKADATALTKNNFTGLDLAALRGHESMVKKLMKLMPEKMVKESTLALRVATKDRHSGVVALLLAANVNPNTEYHDDHSTALHIAAQQGDAVISRLLLDAQADVHAVVSNGNTPLIFAAYSGKIPAIKTYIDAGADVQGSFSYRYAAIKGQHLAAIYLLNKTIPLFDENDPTLTVISHHITDIISDLSEQGDKQFIPQYQKIHASIGRENPGSAEEKSAPAQTAQTAPRPTPPVSRSPEIVGLNAQLEQASRKTLDAKKVQAAEQEQARIAQKQQAKKAQEQRQRKQKFVLNKAKQLLRQEKPQQEHKQEPVTVAAPKQKRTVEDITAYNKAQVARTQREKQRTKREEIINAMFARIDREKAEDYEAEQAQQDDLFQALAADLWSQDLGEWEQGQFWLEQHAITDGDGGPAAQ